jgi:hypothetical protein
LGYLARVKNSIFDNSNGQAGFVLWAPTYHNQAWDGEAAQAGGSTESNFKMNVWFFSTADSSINPENVAGKGFGQALTFDESNVSGMAGSLPDPASRLISQENALVMDARTLAACIRLTYSGRMDRASGQVCFIENLPVASVLGNAEQKDPPISVDSLFQLSGNVQRLGVDTFECIYRADPEHAAKFHDQRDSAMNAEVTSDSIVPPYGFFNTETEVSESARNLEPSCFGFAWRSIAASGGATDLSIELVKTVEWRPAPASGFTAMVPRALSGGPKVLAAQAALDKADPSWTRKIINSAGSLAGQVVKMAATGVGSFLKKSLFG